MVLSFLLSGSLVGDDITHKGQTQSDVETLRFADAHTRALQVLFRRAGTTLTGHWKAASKSKLIHPGPRLGGSEAGRPRKTGPG